MENIPSAPFTMKNKKINKAPLQINQTIDYGSSYRNSKNESVNNQSSKKMSFGII